jgi:hypothetical protein
MRLEALEAKREEGSKMRFCLNRRVILESFKNRNADLLVKKEEMSKEIVCILFY